MAHIRKNGRLTPIIFSSAAPRKRNLSGTEGTTGSFVLRQTQKNTNFHP